MASVLQQYPDLFSGKLGLYPHRKIHLDLVDGAAQFSAHTMKWDDLTIPFKSRSFWTDPYNVHTVLASEIQESKYEQVSVQEVALQQNHLTQQQCQELASVLQQYPNLFSSELGLCPHHKIHLDLVDGAQPIHLHAYSVPHVQVPPLF